MASSDQGNEKIRLVSEAVVDVLALGGLIALAALKPELAPSLIPIIALIAGARVGTKSRAAAPSDRNGIPPTSGAAVLVFALIPLAWNFARRQLGGA